MSVLIQNALVKLSESWSKIKRCKPERLVHKKHEGGIDGNERELLRE